MLSPRIVQYGEDAPLPDRQRLAAGPLTLIWEDGDLRSIRLGDTELLRRIYVAIRDRNWDTVPNEISNLEMDVRADGFRISYDVENRSGGADPIDFTWHAEITGAADGTLRFVMAGLARTTFLKNRIGFCVLHPDDLAGVTLEARHIDGQIEKAALPWLLVPDQPVQPFAGLAGLGHEVRPGVWADLAFEGDVFEMEDQRNWTDASYKTFCTPLRLPYPVEVPAGTSIRQAVTLSLRYETDPQAVLVAPNRDSAGVPVAEVFAAPAMHGEPAPVIFMVDFAARPRPLPPIGLGVASHDDPLTNGEIARLADIGPAHLRVDLWLSDRQFSGRLWRAGEEAFQLGTRLEVALLVSPSRAHQEMAALREALRYMNLPVARWLVFASREEFRGGTPVREVLEAARPVLSDVCPAPIFSGTNADFIFLARSLPPFDLVDGLAFSINPQVHAFDNTSMVETLAAQGRAVLSAQALAPGKPVCVGPITLKMRHNPYATGAMTPVAPGELPPQVDPRQMSLLAAGWTVASIKHVAEAGASSVTYFETTGWRGIMERESGSPVPEKFRSLPGCVFPVYHVFADVAEFRGGEVLPSRSSERFAVDGIALRHGSDVCVLLANFTPASQRVLLPALQGAVRFRLLEASNAEGAMRDPGAFRSGPTTPLVGPIGDRGITLDLPPFALARITL